MFVIKLKRPTAQFSQTVQTVKILDRLANLNALINIVNSLAQVSQRLVELFEPLK